MVNTLADTFKEKLTARDEMVDVFLKKIEDKSAVIGIVGLGYVGVPLAITFLKAGFRVIGFDTDMAKARSISSGISYFKHIKSEELELYTKSCQLRATTDFNGIVETDAIIVCVPTPITEHKDPDMSFIEGATKAVAEHMRDGQLFVLESTTYPGTTDEVVAKIIHDVKNFGVDENYFLAFSPEREDPGNKNFNTKTIPKVVGGATEHSLIVAKALYEAALDHVVPVSSTQVAELTKVFENIYRSVNIALVNELKILCDKLNINVWEVIEAAKTKPFGFQAFYPGPGVGGHCVSGHEKVWVKNGTDIYPISLSTLFNMYANPAEINDKVILNVSDYLMIWSFDIEKKCGVWAKLLRVARDNNPDRKLLDICFKNLGRIERLTVTEDHTMLAYDSNNTDNESSKIHGVLASKLQVGDCVPTVELCLISPRTGMVQVVEILPSDYTGPVYSIDVEGTQTFVTSYGIAVHNCIRPDPYYLSWKVRSTDKVARFIELAGEINDSMPAYVVQKVQDALNMEKKSLNGSEILIVGIAYKRDIEDMRESPAFSIADKLQDASAEVHYYDPYITGSPDIGMYNLTELTKESISKYDCVIVHTDHSCIDYNMIAEHAKLVVDTRNVVPRTFGNVVQA